MPFENPSGQSSSETPLRKAVLEKLLAGTNLTSEAVKKDPNKVLEDASTSLLRRGMDRSVIEGLRRLVLAGVQGADKLKPILGKNPGGTLKPIEQIEQLTVIIDKTRTFLIGQGMPREHVLALSALLAGAISDDPNALSTHLNIQMPEGQEIDAFFDQVSNTLITKFGMPRQRMDAIRALIAASVVKV